MQVHYVFQRPDDLPQGYTVPVGREKPGGLPRPPWRHRELVDGPLPSSTPTIITVPMASRRFTTI